MTHNSAKSPDATSRRSIGLRSDRGPVLLAAMMAMALIAIDSTILATAVPSVVKDLGGFNQFPWLFSIYLLAQAVTVPLFGKLADLYGRKPIMLTGIGIFVVGSVLCGLAWSMTSLILFRALQGVGAGAVSPMSMTIVGDIYSVEELAKVQGYLASVWGTASIIGPTLGGIFADYLTWRWIFFINIPVGIFACWLIWNSFHENVQRRSHRIDFLGAGLLASGASLLVLGLLQGGISWAWTSWLGIGVIASAVILLALFVFTETRAPEPVLPLWIFGNRLLLGTTLASLIVGVLLIGLVSYVPLFAQNVLGTSALVGGFTIAAMTIGWPLAASLAGRFYLRIGFRDTAFLGSGFLLIGTAALFFVEERSPIAFLAASCFVIGLGLGLVAAPILISAQKSVAWGQRGVVTGTNMFARSIGSALGIAMFGAIANAAVFRQTGVNHASLDNLPPRVLASAIHEVFIGAGICALVMIVALAIMPRRSVQVGES